ncbi:lytic polysaccharide monooxygenase auxiliary activity family 9 protein [Streptoalloteichus tenebrarius]|uniref:lytic polysaccharide monooxygenase auxiliary activity family 9 protein n=1 Tax=Streptoalloteichus tenebrarius (strain ATCC 17920 / DSM 40477 / JCM 4838 / CBS 697.72 / NBRC 16177 / NCIMB 11028 / NRRL B-12390 / A12253. 1 / ISP 5477) TaxID=1933 RepID=UPI0027E2EFF1|nr:lytic polysaccharide monooxygenase [Streptoalloteichus tenebrarius]
MTKRRTAATLAALATVPVLLSFASAGTAAAHGSMQNPISRSFTCRNENPEQPKSAACKDAIAMGGTQPFYDWHEVNIPNAAGRHRQIIPDGKLCSAGREKYKGLDQARADWPSTTLPQSGSFTFNYRATAPHPGTFELYVTRNGYDPRQPLKWSDLEPTPFLTVRNPRVQNGSYMMSGQLPQGKSGRHLIYAVWQRSDSAEAFYSCSDVVFGGESGAAAEEAPAQVDPAFAREIEEQTRNGDHAGHGSHHRAVAATGTSDALPLTLGGAALLTVAASGLVLYRLRRAGRERS